MLDRVIVYVISSIKAQAAFMGVKIEHSHNVFLLILRCWTVHIGHTSLFEYCIMH